MIGVIDRVILVIKVQANVFVPSETPTLLMIVWLLSCFFAWMLWLRVGVIHELESLALKQAARFGLGVLRINATAKIVKIKDSL